MSYEDDIRAELALGWIMKSRRKRLEKELAKITAGNAQPITDTQPKHAPTAAPQGAGSDIFIDGDPAFRAATRAALDKLKGTPSWALASQLKGIKQVTEADIGNSEVGGYLSEGVFHCGPTWWQGDITRYASGIAHEGYHASRPHEIGTEAERGAFRAQAQALREMGAPRHVIAEFERDAANPTHHLNWKGPARRAA